jgi:hypothetical protein
MAKPPGNSNAPKATAPNSRRFQTASRDELGSTPHAPNITPLNFITPQHSAVASEPQGKIGLDRMIARVVRELTDIGNTDLRLRAQLQVGGRKSALTAGAAPE